MRGHGGAAESGNVFYDSEFLDVVGPTMTQLTVPATAAAGPITVKWQAQDPTPGAGVAYYEVQVKEDGGAWQDVVPGGTASTSLTYTVRTGHGYTFRVRARDKVNNWGSWRMAGPVTVS